DLLEAEIDRLLDDPQEPRLERRFAAEQRDLRVPVLSGPTDLLQDRLDRHRTRLAESRSLPADAENTAIVAHVPKLDLDLALGFHGDRRSLAQDRRAFRERRLPRALRLAGCARVSAKPLHHVWNRAIAARLVGRGGHPSIWDPGPGG